MAKWLDEFTTLRLRDGAIRIVVVADTHSTAHPKSAAVIAAEHPNHILHADDSGNLAVLDRLAKIAPTSAVRGNIDAHANGVPDTRTIDLRDGDERLFKMVLLHIGANGRSSARTSFALHGPKERASSCAATRTFPSSAAIASSPSSTRDLSARAASRCRLSSAS